MSTTGSNQHHGIDASPSSLRQTTQHQDHQQQNQPLFSCIQILYSTQTGRAKACARRTARILREQMNQPSMMNVSVPVHQSVDQYQLYQKLLQQQLNNEDDHVKPSSERSEQELSQTLFTAILFNKLGKHCTF